jgi:hypothetical protein
MVKYINLTNKKKLYKAEVIVNYLNDNIGRYKNTENPERKEAIAFGIQPLLWFICPQNKYKVIQISKKCWNSFLEDPSITLSFNHIEKRKDVGRRLFETYDYYDWKNDGLKVLEQIINDFEFNILTRKENSANYKGEIELMPISTEMVEKIIKYQWYWKKGWFRNYILSYNQVQKIPLGRNFRNESDLISYIELN